MEAEDLSQLPKVTWHDWFLQGFGFSLCPQRHRVPGNWLSIYSDQGMTLVLCRGKRHKWFPMSRFGILWVGLPPHSLSRAPRLARGVGHLGGEGTRFFVWRPPAPKWCRPSLTVDAPHPTPGDV